MTSDAGLTSELSRLSARGDPDAGRLLARLAGGREERDRLIRRMAGAHFGGMSRHAQSNSILDAIRRYRRRGRLSVVVVCQRAGSLQADLHRLLSAHTVPETVRQMENILKSLETNRKSLKSGG